MSVSLSVCLPVSLSVSLPAPRVGAEAARAGAGRQISRGKVHLLWDPARARAHQRRDPRATQGKQTGTGTPGQGRAVLPPSWTLTSRSEAGRGRGRWRRGVGVRGVCRRHVPWFVVSMYTSYLRSHLYPYSYIYKYCRSIFTYIHICKFYVWNAYNICCIIIYNVYIFIFHWPNCCSFRLIYLIFCSILCVN